MLNLMRELRAPGFDTLPGELTNPQDVVDMVVPKGYESKVVAFSDGESVFIKTVGGDKVESTITVPSGLYNPTASNLHFVKFVLTNLKGRDIELNQVQMLRLFLAYYFNTFRTAKYVFLNTLLRSLQGLLKFSEYGTPVQTNARQKAVCSRRVIPYGDTAELGKWFVKNILSNKMSPEQWRAYFSKKAVFPSSLGSMTKVDTVLLEEPSLRAPAWSVDSKGFTTIFPVKSNVPARLQTHLIGDAYSLMYPDKSLIEQDTTDDVLKECLVVYSPMDMDTGRFMAGEIEVHPSVAETLVNVEKRIEVCFDELEVKVGDKFELNGRDLVLGSALLSDENAGLLDSEDKVVLSGYESVEILAVKETNINGAKRVSYRATTRAGNARIISNTGLKGVTKVIDDTGIVTVGEHTLIPDMIVGMNSVKAKSNTIALSGAVLAVKLGYYTPKNGLTLDSLDEEEVNAAFKSLPEWTYTNSKGREFDVYVGIVYVNFTELGKTYTKFKNMPFSFESGRFLKTDANTSMLYDYIWSTYIDHETCEATKELYSVYLQMKDKVHKRYLPGIPVYSLKELGELFKTKDFVLTKTSTFPADSRLLDEEWNSKGFYIDLSKYEGAPLIRIPSAKVLKMFSGTLANGMLVYSSNLIIASKLVRACTFQREADEETGEEISSGLSLHRIYRKDGQEHNGLLFHQFMNSVQSTLFSGEQTSQHVVQSFIKPLIPGCNLKQVLETDLPENTVCIADRELYSRIKQEAKRTRSKVPQETLDIRASIEELPEEDCEDDLLKVFKLLDSESPIGIAVRNPSLWKTQNIPVKIWDLETFDLYLRLFKGKTIKDVIEVDDNNGFHKWGRQGMFTTYNSDIVLTSLSVLRDSRGDSDGDVLPIFILDKPGQTLLRNMHKTGFAHVLTEETEWTEQYVQDELSSQADLYKDHVYKVHHITFKKYAEYLVSAAESKTSIGSSTIYTWIVSMILEAYQAYYTKHKGVYEKQGVKTPMVRITPEDASLFSFRYTVLVQECCVQGIKHNEEGNAGFEMFFLDKMHLPANESAVRSTLRDDYGMAGRDIDKFLFVLRFAYDNNDLIRACQQFVSMYNKGKLPYNQESLDYWKEFITEHTYFGNLVKDLVAVGKDLEDTSKNALSFLDSILAGLDVPTTKSESVRTYDVSRGIPDATQRAKRPEKPAVVIPVSSADADLLSLY